MSAPQQPPTFRGHPLPDVITRHDARGRGAPPLSDADDLDDDDYEDCDNCEICRLLHESGAPSQTTRLADGSVVEAHDMSTIDAATLARLQALMTSTEELDFRPREAWPASFQGRRKFKRK